MMTGPTAVEDAAGEKSQTSTLLHITTEKLQLTDLEESVKLKFHPYRKPRNEIKAGSVSPEMITEIPSSVISSRRALPRTGATAVDKHAGEKSPTPTLIQITTEKDTRRPCVAAGCLSFNHPKKLQFTDSANSVKLKFHPYRKESVSPEMITANPETVTSSRRTVPAAEIEEFFASAEKERQKRFKDRYNYDIVKDTPLEGRFEWTQLKP
ncbi:putative cyclin-dependent kinase inhibitor [Helianthus anomalus]